MVLFEFPRLNLDKELSLWFDFFFILREVLGFGLQAYLKMAVSVQ